MFLRALLGAFALSGLVAASTSASNFAVNAAAVDPTTTASILSPFDQSTASDFACRTKCRGEAPCSAYAFSPSTGCQLYQGSTQALFGDGTTTGSTIGYSDLTCAGQSSGQASDANSGSPLVCTDYAGQTASMAAQRRGLHSARLHKLVRRMMAEREAELRLAAAS